MRSLVVFFVSFVLFLGTFASPGLSLPRPLRPKGRAVGPVLQTQKEKIKELRFVVGELERKLKIAKEGSELARVRDKLARIRAELKTLQTEGPEDAAPSAAPIPPPPPSPRQMEARPRMEKERSPQFGLSIGYLAGIAGAVAEIRFHNPLEMLSTSLRIGAGYAQGADTAGTSRRHASLVIDGIYRMNPPHAKGLRNYFGGGINYLAYTTGRVSGTLGAQLFYGVEANAGEGQIYGELGYGAIRTGFSPNQIGLNLQIGYRI